MWADRNSCVKRLLTIWILGDGKPGHENQSLGLAEAMRRRVPCDIHRIGPESSWESPPVPDVIVAAGHATHGRLWWLARRHRAHSVVLMRPSLPPWLFDFVIAPRHDFKKPPSPGGRVFASRGALNRVVPVADEPRDGKLILLGGPSKHHGWDGDAMRGMLAEIAGRVPEVELADSRRTPEGFFASLDFIEARHHHFDTPPGWLAARLARAEEVWVTEDSVSMVYEALTGGARVGILPMPRLRENARVIQGLDQLADDGWVTRFRAWKETSTLNPPPEPLAEADRAAAWLMDELAIRQ